MLLAYVVESAILGVISVLLAIGFVFQLRWTAEAAALGSPRPTLKLWFHRIGMAASSLLVLASVDSSAAHHIYPVALPSILVKLSSSVLFLGFSLWLYFTIAILFKQVRRDPPRFLQLLLVSAVVSTVLVLSGAIAEQATNRSYYWSMISLLPSGFLYFSALGIAFCVYCLLRSMLVEFMSNSRPHSHASSATRQEYANAHPVSRVGPGGGGGAQSIKTIQPGPGGAGGQLVGVSKLGAVHENDAKPELTHNTSTGYGDDKKQTNGARAGGADLSTPASSGKPVMPILNKLMTNSTDARPPAHGKGRHQPQPSVSFTALPTIDSGSGPQPLNTAAPVTAGVNGTTAATTPKSQGNGAPPAVPGTPVVPAGYKLASGGGGGTAATTQPSTAAGTSAAPLPGTVPRTMSGTQNPNARGGGGGSKLGAGGGGDSGAAVQTAGRGVPSAPGSTNSERYKHIEAGLRTLSCFMIAAGLIFTLAGYLAVVNVESTLANPEEPAYSAPESGFDLTHSSALYPNWLGVIVLFWYSYERPVRGAGRGNTLTTIQVQKVPTFSKKATGGEGTVNGKPGGKDRSRIIAPSQLARERDQLGVTGSGLPPQVPPRGTPSQRQRTLMVTVEPMNGAGGGVGGVPGLARNTSNLGGETSQAVSRANTLGASTLEAGGGGGGGPPAYLQRQSTAAGEDSPYVGQSTVTSPTNAATSAAAAAAAGGAVAAGGVGGSVDYGFGSPTHATGGAGGGGEQIPLVAVAGSSSTPPNAVLAVTAVNTPVSPAGVGIGGFTPLSNTTVAAAGTPTPLAGGVVKVSPRRSVVPLSTTNVITPRQGTTPAPAPVPVPAATDSTSAGPQPASGASGASERSPSSNLTVLNV